MTTFHHGISLVVDLHHTHTVSSKVCTKGLGEGEGGRVGERGREGEGVKEGERVGERERVRKGERGWERGWERGRG